MIQIVIIVFNLQWIYYFKEPLVVKVKKYKDKIKSIYGNVFKLDFYPNKVYNKLIDCLKFRGVKYD